MYTIYHIQGVKIGCSVNPKARVKEQGYSAFQVLEVHDDIQVASKREIELQLEYGYGRDNKPYTQTVSMSTFEASSKGGKKNVESGHMKTLHSIGGKIGGKIQGPIQGKINAAKVQTCPWCFKTIKGLNYTKWHGDRCKFAW
jgi:hypothetical protein